MHMTAPERRRPRLQMGHLLLWVVGCAVGFAERRSITPLDLPTTREQVIVFSSTVISGIAMGTILTGCVLLVYWRWRGDRSYPSRAGHWLLLRGLALYAVLAALIHSRSLSFPYYWIALLVDLAFLWGLRRRLPRHWVAVFLVTCIIAAIRAVGFTAVFFNRPATSAIGIGSALLDAVAILWAVGRDRRSSIPTDGLHRLGVGTTLALDTANVALYLALLGW
jgi:hypothetical protein